MQVRKVAPFDGLIEQLADVRRETGIARGDALPVVRGSQIQLVVRHDLKRPSEQRQSTEETLRIDASVTNGPRRPGAPAPARNRKQERSCRERLAVPGTGLRRALSA